MDIIGMARTNEDFRRVLDTGEHSQVVVMTIPVGGDIGEEVHPNVDQILIFVEGSADAVLDGERTPVGPNDLVFVKAGTRHNFINTADTPFRLVTIYAPPEHPPNTIHATKAEALAADDH
jgi:mannose-6-phosphate isomerase-like protein (cupin superfamily)